MTYESTDGDSSDAKSRRGDARDKAKAIRLQHRKQERKKRLIVQGVVLVTVIALVAVVGLFIADGIRPAGQGPLNMRSDGILIGKDYVAKQTNATKAGQSPQPNIADANSDAISVEMYVDYFCTACGAFDDANRTQMAKWLDSGTITVEIHPIALLDRVSQGTKYSSRSANAAACVANYSPDQYYDFHSALFDNLPDQNTPGLTNEKLIQLATGVKVSRVSSIADCINDLRFKNWVVESKERALTGPIPNSNVDAVTAAPIIIVNGIKYTGAANDAAAFSTFIVQAAGTSFNEDSTATPSPTPEVPAG